MDCCCPSFNISNITIKQYSLMNKWTQKWRNTSCGFMFIFVSHFDWIIYIWLFHIELNPILYIKDMLAYLYPIRTFLQSKLEKSEGNRKKITSNWFSLHITKSEKYISHFHRINVFDVLENKTKTRFQKPQSSWTSQRRTTMFSIIVHNNISLPSYW